MKWLTGLVALTLLGSIVDTPASAALEWEATADVAAWERLRPGSGTSYVRVKGIHHALVTEIHVLDYLSFPRMKITNGHIATGFISYDACSTNWLYLQDGLITSCYTDWTQDPCVDTVWEAETTAKLEGHVDSGYRTDRALPVTVVCCL